MKDAADHYVEVCRARFGAVAREMTDLGREECPDVYDGISAALLIELAAMMMLPDCTEDMFMEICTDVFAAAVKATKAPMQGQQ